jgi:hypothetical protein
MVGVLCFGVVVLCKFVLLYLCDAQTFAKRNNVKLWWWTPSSFLYSLVVCICHHQISSQSRIIIHIPLKWEETIHNKRPRKSRKMHITLYFTIQWSVFGITHNWHIWLLKGWTCMVYCWLESSYHCFLGNIDWRITYGGFAHHFPPLTTKGCKYILKLISNHQMWSIISYEVGFFLLVHYPIPFLNQVSMPIQFRHPITLRVR